MADKKKRPTVEEFLSDPKYKDDADFLKQFFDKYIEEKTAERKKKDAEESDSSFFDFF